MKHIYSVLTFVKAKYILIEKCLPFCFYVQHSDPINSSKYICLFSGDQRSKISWFFLALIDLLTRKHIVLQYNNVAHISN